MLLNALFRLGFPVVSPLKGLTSRSNEKLAGSFFNRHIVTRAQREQILPREAGLVSFLGFLRHLSHLRVRLRRTRICLCYAQAPIACKHMVSGSLSLPSRGAFHLSLTVLVHYRSLGVFSLTAWSRLLPTRFHVSRGIQEYI